MKREKPFCFEITSFFRCACHQHPHCFWKKGFAEDELLKLKREGLTGKSFDKSTCWARKGSSFTEKVTTQDGPVLECSSQGEESSKDQQKRSVHCRWSIGRGVARGGRAWSIRCRWRSGRRIWGGRGSRRRIRRWGSRGGGRAIRCSARLRDGRSRGYKRNRWGQRHKVQMARAPSTRTSRWYNLRACLVGIAMICRIDVKNRFIVYWYAWQW